MSRSLFPLIAVFLIGILFVLPSVHASTNLTRGIVSYYNLDDGGLTDSVGHNNLVAVGTTVGMGIINDSRYSNDSNNELDAASLGPTSRNNSFTLNLWVWRNDTINTLQAIVDSGAGFSRFNLFTFANGTIGCFMGNVTDNVGVASVADPFGQQTWGMVTCISEQDQQRILLYVNGALADNQTYTNADHQDSIMQFFKRTDGFPFSGSVDEIGLWNHALTNSEVSELYNGSNGNQYPFGGVTPVPPSPPSNVGSIILLIAAMFGVILLLLFIYPLVEQTELSKNLLLGIIAIISLFILVAILGLIV